MFFIKLVPRRNVFYDNLIIGI